MSRCYRVGNGALSPDGPPRPLQCQGLPAPTPGSYLALAAGELEALACLSWPALLQELCSGSPGLQREASRSRGPVSRWIGDGSPPINRLHHVPPAPRSAASFNTWNCSRRFCATRWEQQGEACTGTGFLPSSLTEVLASPAPCPALFHTLPSSFASEVAQAGAPGRGG